MTRRFILLLLALGLTVTAQAAPPCGVVDDGGAHVRALLESDPEGRFDALLDDLEGHRLQILIGEIAEDDAGERCVRVYGLRLGKDYFYPGSSIKVMGAIAALHTLRRAAEAERLADLDEDTPLTVEPGSVEVEGRSWTFSTGTEETDLESMIRRALIVSSNGAYNRLVDVAGRDALNQRMWDAGLTSVRLRHRLSQQGAPDAAHRAHPRLLAHLGGEAPVELRGAGEGSLEIPPSGAPRLEIGSAYIDEVSGERVEGPMNFAAKNTVSLLDLHRMLVDIVDPALSDATLPLSDADRAYLRGIMAESAGANSRATAAERDARFKPLLPGALAAGFERDALRYVGKAGRAFGFHVANAWIEHPESGRSVFVAAAIYANDNGVMNDSDYPYDAITYPFMRTLGEVVARRYLSRADATP